MTRTVQKLVRNSALSTVLQQRAPVAQMTFDQRRRSRQQLTLDTGETIHLLIERGQVLQPGDVLVADDGGLVIVRAQHEQLVRVTADTPIDLTRAAYHLGNRHVTLEVGDGYLQLEYDPVLVQMLNRLGVHTSTVEQPFHPETGAYGGGHKHGHDETFDEDYQLAQAAYHAHEAVPGHSHQHSHMHGRHQPAGNDHHHPHPHAHDHDHGHAQVPVHSPPRSPTGCHEHDNAATPNAWHEHQHH